MFRLQITTKRTNEVFGFKTWRETLGNDVKIIWGNGQETIITKIENPSQWTGFTMSYINSGTYEVSLSGSPFRIKLIPQYNSLITKILQWGNNQWVDGDFNFSGCQNLDVIASDTPNLSGMKSLSQVFDGCRNLIFTQSSLNSWNTSSIEDLSASFRGCVSFRGNVSNWDVTKVRNISYTFENVPILQAHGMTGIHPLGKWSLTAYDLSHHMSDMFSGNQRILDRNNFIIPDLYGFGLTAYGLSGSYILVDTKLDTESNRANTNLIFTSGTHSFTYYTNLPVSSTYTGYDNIDTSGAYVYNSYNQHISPNQTSSTQSQVIYLRYNTSQQVHTIHATQSGSDNIIINATDALNVSRHFTNTQLFNDRLKEKAADINRSGTLNSTDSLNITRSTAQIIPRIPGWVLHPATFSISDLTDSFNHPSLGPIPRLTIRIRKIGDVS